MPNSAGCCSLPTSMGRYGEGVVRAEAVRLVSVPSVHRIDGYLVSGLRGLLALQLAIANRLCTIGVARYCRV